MITIKDIAKLADVSMTTVSKVLNDKADNLSEDTINKIQTIIKEQGYVPYKKVLDKAAAKSHTVALIISDVSDIFCAELLKGVEDYFYDKKYSVIICNTYGNYEKEQSYVELLKEKNIQGIMQFPLSSINNEYIENLEFNDIHSVVVGNYKDKPKALRTYFNNKEGAYMATKHLIQNEHVRIGYITRLTEIAYLLERYDGYKQALEESNIDVDDSIVYVSKIDDRQKSGYDGAKYLMSQGVTAIFCSDDRVAVGAYNAINETNYKIPMDISIVGFDNSIFCQLMTPNLTSIQQSAYEIGYTGAEMLYSKINDIPIDTDSVVLQPRLICRDSVSKPNLVKDTRKKEILVIGDLRVDIIMEISDSEKQVQKANSFQTRLGGFALEKSLSVCNSDNGIYVIGKLGNDQYGQQIYKEFIKHNIKPDGLVFDNELPTGTGFITISPDGKTNTVINEGANSTLTAEHISAFSQIFDKISHCFMSKGYSGELIHCIECFCKKYKVKLELE